MNWRRWGIGVLAVLAGVIGLWQLSKARTFQVFGELRTRVETQEKVVALTFDDGPGPHNTPALLELLAVGQGGSTQDPRGLPPSGSGSPADMSSATGR